MKQGPEAEQLAGTSCGLLQWDLTPVSWRHQVREMKADKPCCFVCGDFQLSAPLVRGHR